MADHISVTVQGGGTKVLQTTDNTTYHTPAHQMVNAAGTTTLGIFAEDAAHSSAHTGLMALGVRQDTAAALGGTDGDYMPPIFDASGRLWVNAGAIGTITPGTAATSLGKAEDVASAGGDVGVMVLAKRTDTTPAATSGTDGDYEPLQVFQGRLWVTAVIDTALPAGTNAIGKLAANSGVDIGDVDVTSVITGTGATNLGKAEDAAHTGGDVGVMALSVRQDTAAALSGTDADYQPLITDGSGRLHVNVGSLAPGNAATSLGKLEDAAHTTGDLGVMALAVRNDTHTTALAGTDGDYVPLGTDSTGKLGIRGTFAEDAAHTSGDLGVQVLSVRTDVSASLSGTTADYNPLITDESGKLWVHPTIDVSSGVTAAAFVSADASGAAVAATDAPSAGKKLVITDILVSVGATAQTVSFTEETSGTLFARVYLPVNGSLFVPFTSKQKLATADKKLFIQTSAAGNVSTRVSYRSEL